MVFGEWAQRRVLVQQAGGTARGRIFLLIVAEPGDRVVAEPAQMQRHAPGILDPFRRVLPLEVQHALQSAEPEHVALLEDGLRPAAAVGADLLQPAEQVRHIRFPGVGLLLRQVVVCLGPEAAGLAGAVEGDDAAGRVEDLDVVAVEVYGHGLADELVGTD